MSRKSNLVVSTLLGTALITAASIGVMSDSGNLTPQSAVAQEQTEQISECNVPGTPGVLLHCIATGEPWQVIGDRYGLSGLSLARQNGSNNGTGTPNFGRVLHVVPAVPPTTTTVVPTSTSTSTTVVDTTTTSTSTSTTSTTSTSSTTTTTTSPPTTTTTLPSTGDFIEDFGDGENWRTRWALDVHHRGDHDDPPNPPAPDSWRADHDMSCGGADTFRVMNAHGDRSQHFYRCGTDGGVGNAHLMTSMGDVDGYSTLSMSPIQSFPTITQVCWDQNVTEQGGRQWTEVLVVPASKVSDGDLTHVNPEFFGVDHTSKQHDGTTWGIMVHGQYWGLNVFANGTRYVNSGYQWDRDIQGQESRAIRRQHCITANPGANTVTVSIGQGVNGTFVQTFPGHFPTDARVILEQHSYTPDKDGEACRQVGSLTGCRYTWHWDNVTVRQ